MYKLYFAQKIPINLNEAWDFFSCPLNLEKITPNKLSLKIKNHDDKKLYPGQIIIYSVKPIWHFTVEWVTEIVAVENNSYFIDEQKFGPYAFWHHEHWFREIPNGVLMEDIIYYKIPYGFFGKALNYLKIKKDIYSIFSHRSKILENIFGIYVDI